MHPIDLLIVSSYVIFSIIVGLRSKEEASTNLEEYFLAGRSLKGWQAGLSMAAAQFAADTPLLVTGLIATAGIFSLWRLWVYALAFLMLGFVLGPSWRRAGVITDAELTEVRYGEKPALVLRIFKAIYLGTIFNCAVLAMVLLAATRIAEPFLTWHLWLPHMLFDPVVSFIQWIHVPLSAQIHSPDVWILSANNLISILTICAVTTFYSTTGGLRNVVMMDIFQFCLKMLGTAVYAFFVVKAIGGLEMIPIKLHQLFAHAGPAGMTADQILAFTPGEAKNATSMILMVFMVQWIAQINADGSGYLAQRTMACRSDKDAKQATVIFTVVQVICRTLLWLPIGLGLLLIFPPDLSLTGDALKSSREATYVAGMASLLPVGMKGLMVTAMLTALGSTVDTHINWGSSYWTNDIYKRLICQTILKREPNPRTLVWVARLCNLGILALALVIMTTMGSIQQAWKTSLLLGAGLGGVLILRWLWWRFNAWGEIASILTTIALLPFFLTYFHNDELRMLTLAGIATVVGIVVSLLKGPEDMSRLKDFYLRARPPGFWGPVAEAAGEDPNNSRQRFYYGLGATFLAAFSVFTLLIGVGTLVCGSPVPAWFTLGRNIWIGGLVAVSLAAVPFWWRMAFQLHIVELPLAVDSLEQAYRKREDEEGTEVKPTLAPTR
jgi:SSS family solute:Na+ symporter